MGLVIATTGPDFQSGDNENIAVDFEGTARLAPIRNIIPDPNLYDFESDGLKHRYWDLLAPERPTHWSVYMRDNNHVRNFSRQTMAPLPLGLNNYQHVDELIRGSGLIDPSNALAISNPDVPRASTFQVGQHVGFPAGYVVVAFGWILGPRNYKESPYYTPPGNISEPLEIAQGQGIQVTIPQVEIPAGVEGIIIYMSYPSPSIDVARNATLYPQSRIPSKSFNTITRLFGPFIKRYPASPHLNRSYWGENLPQPRAWNTSSRFGHRRMIQVRLSYTLFSERGTASKSSDVHPTRAGWVHTARPGKNRVNFRPPTMPVGAVQWQPEIQFYVDGEWTGWYKLVKKGSNNGRFNRNETAQVIVADPTKWYKEAHTKVVKLPNKSNNDATGIAPPEEGLELPTRLDINSSGLTPGLHQIKTSLWVGDEEGRGSPAKKLNVPMGRGIRVNKPLFHNRMPNSNASEISRDDPDVPDSWWVNKPFPSNLNVYRIPGGMKVNDRRGVNGTVLDLFSTPFALLLEDEDRYTVKFRVHSDNYNSGVADAYLDEYDNNEQYLRTTRVTRFQGSYRTNVTLRIERRNTDPDNPNIYQIGTDAAFVRIRMETRGGPYTNPTNYSFNFTHWIAYAGWGDPRVVDMQRLSHNRSGNVITDEDEHPEGGYCVVVEEPEDNPKKFDAAVLENATFENGKHVEGFNVFREGSNSLQNYVTQTANLVGAYGLRIRKTDDVQEYVQNYVWKDYPEAEDSIAVVMNTYVRQLVSGTLHNNQILHLGGISDTNDRPLAYLYWRYQTRELVLRTYGADGSATDVVGTGYDLKELLSAEIHVWNAGTTNGAVRAYIGTNFANRELVIQSASIDWTDRRPKRIKLGVVDTFIDNPPLRFDIFYDNVIVSLNSTESYTRQDGNYIEYYGPARTPRSEHYGPEGMRVPVKPNTVYTMGVNLWYRDLSEGSAVLRFSSMDKYGNINKHHGATVKGLVGDRDWNRQFLQFRTGPEATHIEFYGNLLGAGLIKIHGIGLEEGTARRAYSGKNERSGNMSLYFSTRLPDLTRNDDPVYSMGQVSRIRDIQVIGTDDDETSYSVSYRQGNAIDTLGDSITDWGNLNKGYGVYAVDIGMSTTNENNSPEIEEVQLDLARPVSQLCRADGTEFDGGVLVRNIGAILPVRDVENIELASGGIAKTTKGEYPVSWFRGLEIEAYRDHTVSEIVNAYGYGNSEFVLEQENARYTIVFEELPEFTVKPKSRIRRDGYDFVVHTADGINAYIVGIEEGI